MTRRGATCVAVHNERARRLGLRGRRGDAGYAVVDALVALTVFATTIVFAMVAVHTANQGAKAALEARQADEVLKAVLDRATTTVGLTQGRGERFAWQLRVHPPVLSASAASLCQQDAEATALATGRQYHLSSARICPSGANS